MSIEILGRPVQPTGSEVVLSEGLIRIRDEAAFGVGRSDLCTRFLGRVFALGEVRSVTIDRVGGVALIRHTAGPAGLPEFLTRLADSIRGRADHPAPGFAPPFLGGLERFTVRRHGAILTTAEVILDGPGRLQLGHESLRGNRSLAEQVVSSLRAVPGVLGVRAAVGPGRLAIRYSPSSIPAVRLIRLAEASLNRAGSRPPVPELSIPTKLGLANVSLGIATVEHFLLPVLLPVSAVLLVGTNLRIFRVAWLQVRSRRLGLAVLYTAIVATTLATGQFLASALMTWSFRYWHHRFRSELASERGRLLGPQAKESRMARMATTGGPEVLVSFHRLHLGDRVTVSGGETVPADGRVVGGEGVVDERSVRGPEGISRKRLGDFVMADARVLAGSMEIEVSGVGDRTRAASIRRALIASTNPAPGSLAPTIRSEAFASRAVGPTLATAGVGLLAGDLLTVGAILRPDYATGPGLAVPLETLRLVTLLARRGIVVRDPGALERLAEVDLMVLDDHPALSRIELEVTRVETRLPESIVLRYAASAFRHLVDDRSMALTSACRMRRVHLLDLEPVDLRRGVAVTHGSYQVRVFDPNPSAAADSAGPLLVEIDGTNVGLIEFARTSRLEAASTLARIRQGSPTPIAFALVSSRGEAEVSALAGALGVELYRGSFSAGETAAFLRGCRDRGIRTAFVGDCQERPEAAREAHVALSFVGEADLESDPAGLLLQQPRTRSLADLRELSRKHAGRVRQAENFILVPNLLCVAGAFLFGFTGMTAVMLTNLGTLGLYRRASDSLRELDTPGPRRTGSRHRAG